jgi:hypothetical protein
LHGVDVVKNVGGIDFDFFDLTTSNIIGSSSNVENMAIDNLASSNVAIVVKVI